MTTSREFAALDTYRPLHLRELTREEGMTLLDREAQRYLHMSAEESIRAWEAGKFDDDPDRPDVMYGTMLLPFAQ